MSSGFLLPLVTGSRNEMFGNTRCVLMLAPPVARGGAIQVVLLGRASNPGVVGGGFGGSGGSGSGGEGGGGCGEVGGGSCAPSPLGPSPLSQPAVISKAKDNNVAVACPPRGMGASSYL